MRTVINAETGEVTQGEELVLPPPDPAEVLAAQHAAINAERDRRLANGAVVTLPDYGDIPLQGRPHDQINLIALKDTARDLADAGVTTPVVPFRDAENNMHLLTPAQMIAVASAGKSAAGAIYATSFAMKDGTAPFEAGIPDDVTDDQWWP